MSDDPKFLARALEWVQNDRDPRATEVRAVVPYGTDWDGDTECGFYSHFDVEIHYSRGDEKKSLGVEGEDMASLWEWMVSRDW